jgi:UDP-N-acetylglucosamine:LPS N-acetylglucosamine transferase
LFKPVKGQEQFNADFFMLNGAAIVASNIKILEDKINLIEKNPEIMLNLQKNISFVKQKGLPASKKIANVIEEDLKT